MGLGLGVQVARSAEEDSGPVLKIHQQTTRSFVIVSYHLQKSERPYMNEGDAPELAGGTVLQRILNKNAMDVIGVLLNDQGAIFTFDREPTHREVIARITVRGPDGTVLPARAERLLTKTPGRILRIEGTLPAGWQPLQFAELGEMTPQTKLFVATMGIGKYYHIYVRPCEYGLNWDNGQTVECGPSLRVPGVYAAGVLCDDQGRPVGVTSLDEIDLGPGGPAWRGKDILADPGISEEQQVQLEEKLQKQFARNIYEIRIMPRPEPQEEEEIDFGRRFRGRYPGQQPVQEVLVYGLGFADNKLLIPDALPKELAAGIDTITVKVGESDVPGRFAGVLKECCGTVIELPEGKLPQTIAFPAEGKVARLEPFWAVYATELAGMDIRIECSRWIDRLQGYEDKWYPAAERALPPGSWVVGRAGNLVGFVTQARHEWDRLEPYLIGRDQSRYRAYRTAYTAMVRSRTTARTSSRYGYSGEMRLLDAVEMARMLGGAPASYDPHVKHLDKDEQKRRVWLGVEYTVPEKEMLKQMGLREPTQDGRLGVLVNRVYPGSPAAEMGLTEGDILLRIAVPGMPWPIELAGDERESYGVPDFDEADIPRELGQMPRRRPWPSQDNYVNRLLGEIGRGTAVKLSYLHGSTTLEKEFTIQQAPRDMLSAAKYKDEVLGLTVKDVTYEVRAALRLEANDPTIVVVRIEQGTPAALARINMYELIRAVDGVSVDNVETFETLITQARAAKKDSVRLTIEWMGKTRLADLKFEARPPIGPLNPLLRDRNEP
jgi:C-terminal processing protease CtpA/Prc